MPRRERLLEDSGVLAGYAALGVRDMTHCARFIMDTLLQHPSVQDCRTSFVLQRLKGTTPAPV